VFSEKVCIAVPNNQKQRTKPNDRWEWRNAIVRSLHGNTEAVELTKHQHLHDEIQGDVSKLTNWVPIFPANENRAVRSFVTCIRMIAVDLIYMLPSGKIETHYKSNFRFPNQNRIPSFCSE
jgi:hypothetical protein